MEVGRCRRGKIRCGQHREKNIYLFGFSLFFCYFLDFLKTYQKMGQKLNSNTQDNKVKSN